MELLAKSMGLTESKPVATPRLKRSFTDEVMDLALDEEDEINSATVVAPLPCTIPGRTVQFSSQIESRNVLSHLDKGY